MACSWVERPTRCSMALSAARAYSASFAIEPAAILVTPWAPCLDVVPGRTAPAECLRPESSRPREAASSMELAELPYLKVAFVDGSAQPLSSMLCEGCVTADLSMLPGQGGACQLLGIPDPDPACAPVSSGWVRSDNAVCNLGGRFCSDVEQPGCAKGACKRELETARSAEACQAACGADDGCVAIT